MTFSDQKHANTLDTSYEYSKILSFDEFVETHYYGAHIHMPTDSNTTSYLPNSHDNILSSSSTKHFSNQAHYQSSCESDCWGFSGNSDTSSAHDLEQKTYADIESYNLDSSCVDNKKEKQDDKTESESTLGWKHLNSFMPDLGFSNSTNVNERHKNEKPRQRQSHLTAALEAMWLLRYDDYSFFENQIDCVVSELARIITENAKFALQVSGLHNETCEGKSTENRCLLGNSFEGWFDIMVKNNQSSFPSNESIGVSNASLMSEDELSRTNANMSLSEDWQYASKVWLVCQNNLMVAYKDDLKKLVEKCIPLDTGIILEKEGNTILLEHQKLETWWKICCLETEDSSSVLTLFNELQYRIQASKNATGIQLLVLNTSHDILYKINEFEYGRSKVKRLIRRLKKTQKNGLKQEEFVRLESKIFKTMNIARLIAGSSLLALARYDCDLMFEKLIVDSQTFTKKKSEP